ncbi:hypothetical protein QU481_05205 [Crenobacter sp. SG2303]|uniref:DUF2523 domain-containing protein n=1 Tax=Crenobacter oryzisoli TaxID=3056844 RepID=A0ABT7XKR0_9NEIS|nr:MULTISPECIES: hypothetical protein [unclassified Crenobacter]MDN0074288.1 hypothetical protein [Crenobacter sp. SG2303]MDN0082238.1 hypothetical protein [Crenobacter sp. SG2305]
MTWLYRRPFWTFWLMGASFLLFGSATVNLALLLKLNFDLWVEVGWQAAMDGALRQLFELLLSGYGAMAAYVVFKCCEKVLVETLTRRDTSHNTKTKRESS